MDPIPSAVQYNITICYEKKSPSKAPTETALNTYMTYNSQRFHVTMKKKFHIHLNSL